MSWVEQETKERKTLRVSDERAALLDQVKAEKLPVVQAEAARGSKPVESIRFQEVRSPGLFEAEFAKRDDDVIFHFWPYGLHKADREGQPRPAFQKDFRPVLKTTMEKRYGKVEIVEDRDMGAIFVRVRAAGAQQFWYDLAVKAVTLLHSALGGEG